MRNAKLFVVNSTQVLRPGIAMYTGVLDAGLGLSLIVQWAAGCGCLNACCLVGSRESGGLRRCTTEGASYSTTTT